MARPPSLNTQDPDLLGMVKAKIDVPGNEPYYIKTQLTKWYQSNIIINAQKNKTTHQRA
jgi:hypothetical protein